MRTTRFLGRKGNGFKALSVGVGAALFFGLAAQSLASAAAERYGYIQANCPNLVKQAVDAVSTECNKTGRGQLCYGNANIQAEFQPGVNSVVFNAPGDLVDVNAIKQFTLSGLDAAANTWGVAEMKIKADLPDTNLTQAVTMVMFGSVKIVDASADAQYSQTPGAVDQHNQQSTATARAANAQATKAIGTATRIAGLVATSTARALTPTATGTVSTLKATQAAATATKLANIINTATAAAPTAVPANTTTNGIYTGLQAFYFQSGDSAPCEQAPHDGLLIQSPQGLKKQVTVQIDGVTIALGSTVYVTAQADGFLTVTTLEGGAQITTPSIGSGICSTQMVVPGTSVRIPLDTTLHATSSPTCPIPIDYYTPDMIRALPVQLLPDTITVAPGLPPNTVFNVWRPAPPPAGVTYPVDQCDQSFLLIDLYFKHTPFWLYSDSSANNLWLMPEYGIYRLLLSKSPDGTFHVHAPFTYDGNFGLAVYKTPFDNPKNPVGIDEQIALKFTSSTHIDGQEIVDDGGNHAQCSGIVPFALDIVPNQSLVAVSPTPTEAVLQGQTSILSDNAAQLTNVSNLPLAASSFAFNPDTTAIAIGGDDNTVKLYDANTGKLTKTYKGDSTISTDPLINVAFSPNGQFMAAGDTKMGYNRVYIWDVASAKLLQTLQGAPDAASNYVAFSPDGKTLLNGGGTVLQLWMVATGKLLSTFKLASPQTYINGVAFSADGKTIAAVSTDKTVQVFTVATGKLAFTIKDGAGSGYIQGLAFDAGGRQLASTSQDNVIHIWDATTGTAIQQLSGHTGPVYSLAFNVNSQLLASAGTDGVYIWDLATGHPAKFIPVPGGASYVAFSPNGTLLAFSASGQIALWAATS